MLELYASTIEKIGVGETLPLYVASGLLTYQGNQGVLSSMQGGAEAVKHSSSSSDQAWVDSAKKEQHIAAKT